MLKTMDLSTSGMMAQRIRTQTIAGNLANITTMRNEDGDLKPYEPRFTIFQTVNEMGPNGSAGVMVREIVRDDIAPQRVFSPKHPDADADGYIYLPNINMMTEFTDAIEAARSYEANLGAMEITKSMMNQTLRIIT